MSRVGLQPSDGESLGFQITFFRTKPDIDAGNPSDFTPRQIIIAHCALSDPKRGTLWQDQRIRRAALGLAGAAEGDTHVWVDRWSLQRTAQTLHCEDRRRGFLVRPRAVGNAGGAHQWRRRRQPQGTAAASGELLLQSAAHAGCRERLAQGTRQAA